MQCGVRGCGTRSTIGELSLGIKTRSTTFKPRSPDSDPFTQQVTATGEEPRWWRSPRLVLLKVMHEMCVSKLDVTVLSSTYMMHVTAREREDGEGVLLTFAHADFEKVLRDMDCDGRPVVLVASCVADDGRLRGRVLGRRQSEGELVALQCCSALYQAFVNTIDREARRRGWGAERDEVAERARKEGLADFLEEHYPAARKLLK